jgi:mannitol operon repressor
MAQLPFDDQFYDRLRLFLDACNAETDRGKSLVSASIVEEMLAEILKAFLAGGAEIKRLFDAPNAPLSTLSSKALMCRSLRLINAVEYRDIDLVRKIRNEFAHSVTCSFEDQKIRNWAQELKVGMAQLDDLDVDHKSRVHDARQRFGMVTTSIVSNLYNRAHYVKKLQISDREFPD